MAGCVPMLECIVCKLSVHNQVFYLHMQAEAIAIIRIITSILRCVWGEDFTVSVGEVSPKLTTQCLKLMKGEDGPVCLLL